MPFRPLLAVVFAFSAITIWPGVALLKAADSGMSGISFELDVQPILTARGCNAGACHGKARGQNGFQLSLLGFDADFDFAALTQHARGRRVFTAAPERSLILQKSTGQLPHGGGKRIEAGGDDYRALLAWIAAGTPRRVAGEPSLNEVMVEPAEQFLQPKESFELQVTARYSDGTTRDVTARTAFQSSEAPVVAVDDAGVVTAGPIPGEASVMARFMGAIATCEVAIPLPGEISDDLYANLPRNNFIDELVWTKLESLGITPSPPVDDAKYMRRVYLDIIGRLPAPEEVRVFLADEMPDKREKLVDRLLERPEYADHQTAKWNDLLLPNPYRVGIKATLNYDNWIRQSFRENKPYDQFVRELITAEGSTFKNGATVLFRDRRSPDEVTMMVSQLFLGIRLECAKCHQHPFEKWGQGDFYGLAAYFARVGHRGGISPPISGGEEKVYLAAKGEVAHPLTGEVLAPRPLFGDAPQIGEGDDPREALARWMTSPENDFFAMTIANRTWNDMMGRGLVEPVDDLRATNPPSNAPLLEALADELRRNDFDLKKLIRAIAASHVYALGSAPTDRNVADTRNYSRHYRQRLRAEVLLDAVCDVTEVDERFSAMPPGSRATQLWTRRVDSTFLDTFGRPDMNQDPPCERTGETAVTQALHLMNSPNLHAKVTSDQGRAARLAESNLTPTEIIEELYLATYNRYPAEQETQVATSHFEKEDVSRRQATEDILWTLLNTPEFVFND